MKLSAHVKVNITKYITSMRNASTPKLKLAARILHVYSFVVYFLKSKFLLDVFHQTNLKFDQLEHVLFFKKLDQKMFHILLYIISNLFGSTMKIKCIVYKLHIIHKIISVSMVQQI